MASSGALSNSVSLGVQDLGVCDIARAAGHEQGLLGLSLLAFFVPRQKPKTLFMSKRGRAAGQWKGRSLDFEFLGVCGEPRLFERKGRLLKRHGFRKASSLW